MSARDFVDKARLDFFCIWRLKSIFLCLFLVSLYVVTNAHASNSVGARNMDRWAYCIQVLIIRCS
jgi:hypothetical protein